MPSQPIWYSRIDSISAELRAVDKPYVGRSELERVLNVGRRRAQQIMAPAVSERVGTNGLADRSALIAHLQNLARGDTASFEVRRRRRVADTIGRLAEEFRREPKLLVEAPVAVMNQELADLPAGVTLAPGRVTVEFEDPQEALQKLLALAMAIGNDLDAFAEMVAPRARGAAG